MIFKNFSKIIFEIFLYISARVRANVKTDGLFIEAKIQIEVNSEYWLTLSLQLDMRTRSHLFIFQINLKARRDETKRNETRRHNIKII